MHRVVVGGTFDILHKGHKALLTKAASHAGKLFVGLASDILAGRRTRNVRPYEERYADLKAFLDTLHVDYEIKSIDHPYGGAANGNYDIIVVSPETLRVADEINSTRKRKGLVPMRVTTVDFVMADDGKPISASRISSGEIDAEGKVRGR